MQCSSPDPDSEDFRRRCAASEEAPSRAPFSIDYVLEPPGLPADVHERTGQGVQRRRLVRQRDHARVA